MSSHSRYIEEPLDPSSCEGCEPRARERTHPDFPNKANDPPLSSDSAVPALGGLAKRGGIQQLSQSFTELPLAYRIPAVCLATGLGRTSIYAAIKSGALIARRWNRCTIVLAEDLAAFLSALPTTNGR